MSYQFPSPEAALAVLADQNDPQWGAAFAYLVAHPATAALMLEVFQETLDQLGVTPSGRDPTSDEPIYTLEDIALALGVSVKDIEPG